MCKGGGWERKRGKRGIFTRGCEKGLEDQKGGVDYPIDKRGEKRGGGGRLRCRRWGYV